MTGPDDPGDDWGFPEVDPAGPASTSLPPPEPAPETGFDTGSDAWWRAQAQAQRAAAQSDPVVPPAPPAEPEVTPAPELVEPQVLSAPSPLDSDWQPPDLPELRPAAPVEAPVEPEAQVESAPPAAEHPVADLPEPEPEGLVEAVPPAAVPPAAEQHAPEVEPEPDTEPEVRRVVPAVGDTDPVGFTPVPPLVTPVPVPPRATPPAPAAAAPAAATSYEDEVARSRTPVEPERVGPARAVAGAALAVAGVALGIGALLVLGDDEPTGTPTVALPSATAAVPTTPPTAVPEPTVAPTTAAPSPTAVAITEEPTPAAEAPRVVVAVLNNSKVKGLADRSAARFRAGGWPVGTVGNYRGGVIEQTTVYYADGQQASAERFAREFGIPRVRPRFAGLPTQGMTVVVTRDYA